MPAIPCILVGSVPLRHVLRCPRMGLLTETVGPFSVSAIQAPRYLTAFDGNSGVTVWPTSIRVEPGS